MLTRAQIKENAKAGFRAAYWPGVGTLVLIFLVISASSALGIFPPLAIAAVVLLAPIYVGECGYFLGIYRRDGDTRVGRAFNIAFSQNYGRKLGGMLWMELWCFLWILLVYAPLIIGFVAVGATAYATDWPRGANVSQAMGAMGAASAFIIAVTIGLLVLAIIKMLAYYMTPYILADCPNVSATNALTLSKRMTKGHKGDIFVMGLSFIGWALLTALTFGILGIFWVGPYSMAAMAGQYDELKRNAIATVKQALDSTLFPERSTSWR